MTIVLDHAVVPVPDKRAGATFLAELLDLAVSPSQEPFALVVVNEGLTLAFDDQEASTAGHFGFRVDQHTFGAVVERLGQWPAVEFGSAPEAGWDRRIDDSDGTHRVFVKDPGAGHVYEFFTA